MSTDYSYSEYLAAKKTVDDRALSSEVFDILQSAWLENIQANPVKILELGAGIGTMAERLLNTEIGTNMEYTLLDLEPESLDIAFRRLGKFLRTNGWKTVESVIDETIEASRGSSQMLIRFRTADALQFASVDRHHREYDILAAHAVLDIFHIESALPVLFQTLKPGGLYYFTLNYDGHTTFHPTVDEELDSLIEARYNASMDKIRIAGNPRSGSRTGDHLLAYLERETDLLAYGDSDWEVTPNDSTYQYEEEFFVRCILKTMKQALTGDPMLDETTFLEWLDTRYTQLDAGTLTFTAHNLDFCGMLPYKK